jgi:hypothetical protein
MEADALPWICDLILDFVVENGLFDPWGELKE